MGDVMRVFIGLPVPDEAREVLAAVQRRWKPRLASRVTWTRPENWHLTLRFVGYADEEQVAGIRERLARIAFAPFSVQPGGAGFFPPRAHPRVAWVGIGRGAAESGTLARAVDEALIPLGWEPAITTARPFRAHLTLARIKEPRRDSWDELAADAGDASWPAWTADRFVLWRSVLGSAGPTYTPLAEFPAA